MPFYILKKKEVRFMKLKKWLLGLVTFAAMAVLCAVCAGAEMYYLGLEFREISDDTVEITGYSGDEETLVIPDRFDEVITVASIGSGAFSDCTSLKRIIIPNSVTNIANDAFSGCTSLTSITIPGNVTEIGGSAFSGCTSLAEIKVAAKNLNYTSVNGVLYNKDKTTIICYPDGKKDKNYKIPNGVTKIGSLAFSNCSSFTSITIPNSVTSIGDDAFSGCKSLTSVTIPNGVTSIGDYAFYKCSNLTSITIPNSVTSIGDGAFSGCTSLTSITIPNSVTSIGNWTFRGCTSLTSITIPSSVTEIGKCAFEGCENLKNITIPTSVKYIEEMSFYNCALLKSVTIPASVTSIGSNAFGYRGNDNETKKVNGFKINYTKNTHGHYYATRNGFSNETCLITENLDNGTLAISKYAGVDKTFSIPSKINGKSVTSIGNSAFSSSKNLTGITIPDSVTSIDYYAFNGCTSLKSITIPNSTTSIGVSAFERCTGLTSVTIKGNATNIGEYAFYSCTGLTSVTIQGSATNIGERAFEDCTGLTSVKISGSVTSIGECAFNDCESLESIQMLKGETSIGDYAFADCTNLKSATFNSVKSIGYRAFEKCKGLKSLKILNGVADIGDFAFDNCVSLESVNIQNGETSIGSSAFAGCKSLTSVTISNVKNIGYEAFANCTALTNVKIDHLNKIEDYAFFNCASLVSIHLADDLTYIGKGAFKYCSGLTGIELPDSLTYIDDFAFIYCDNLESVTIMYNVTYIGEAAFFGCTSLTSITIPDSVTSIGKSALGSGVKFFKIRCYKGSAAEQYAKDNGIDHQLLDYHTHNFGEWKTTKAATYTSTGTKMRMCSVCNRTEIATIAKRTLTKVTGAKLTGRAADALRINWTKNASADGYIVEMYKGGKWVRAAKIAKNSTTTYRASGLKAGTAYKFRVRAYKISGKTAVYGAYSATVAARTNPSVVKGAKLTGRAADALRINWTKNTSADGYIVEMYQGNKWVRAGKITNNSTTTYRASGLKASTVYKFRVRAYKMSGKTALYGNYSATVTARTNPSTVKGVKIAGKAKDALRLSWTKNTSAQGYVVEMYKGGKWVRVAKIAKNSTTTYRKAGLAKNTTYKFRVKAYYMSGKTALYGGYGSVSGKTAAK